MIALSYIFIGAFILFFGGIWANAKSETKRYGFLFFTVVVMGLAGLFLSFGTLDVLPKIVW